MKTVSMCARLFVCSPRHLQSIEQMQQSQQYIVIQLFIAQECSKDKQLIQQILCEPDSTAQESRGKMSVRPSVCHTPVLAAALKTEQEAQLRRRRETARPFVSLNILLSHSRSL